METETYIEETKHDLDTTQETSFNEKIKVVEIAEIVLPEVAEGKVPLGPITPNPDKESVETLIHCISPLTSISSTPVVVSSDSGGTDQTEDLDSSCRTPKDDVFNSFAPGPDALMLAPRVNKFPAKSRKHVSRRLNFDLLDDSDEDSDKVIDGSDTMDVLSNEGTLLDSIYESYLNAVVSKKIEEVVAETFLEGLKTPTSVPYLNGIAETCPGAPKKPWASSRKIDSGVRRKLEF